MTPAMQWNADTGTDRNSRAQPLALLTDADLDAMTRRAYAGAASAWRALQRPLVDDYGPMSPDDARTIRAFQYADAESLDAWYAELRAEAERRKADR